MLAIFMLVIGFLMALCTVALFNQVREFRKEKYSKPNRFQNDELMTPTMYNLQNEVIGRNTLPMTPFNEGEEAEFKSAIDAANIKFAQEDNPDLVDSDIYDEPVQATVVILDDEDTENKADVISTEEMFGVVSKVPAPPLNEDEIPTATLNDCSNTIPFVAQKEEEVMKKTQFADATLEDKPSKGFEDSLNALVNNMFDPLIEQESVDEVQPQLTANDADFINQMTNFEGFENYQPEINPVNQIILTLDDIYDETNLDAEFLHLAPLFADEYEHQLAEGVSGFRSWIVQVVGCEGDYLHVTDGTGRLWLDAEHFSHKSIGIGDFLAIDAQEGEIVTLTVLKIEDYINKKSLNAVS